MAANTIFEFDHNKTYFDKNDLPFPSFYQVLFCDVYKQEDMVYMNFEVLCNGIFKCKYSLYFI